MENNIEYIENKVNSSGSKKYNSLINVLFIIIVFVALFSIVYNNRSRLDEYKETLLNINYINILIILAFTISSHIFRSWRWYYLLLPIKKTISFLCILRVTISALVANFTMPGKLGVPVKAIFLKKEEKIEMSKSLPSILGEIFIEHSTEFMMAVVCVIIGGHLTKFYHVVSQLLSNQNALMNIAIGLGFCGLIILAFFVFKKKIRSIDFFDKFWEAFIISRRRYDYLSCSYLITLVNLIISYYVFWFLLKTLGHPEIDVTFVIFAGTITNIMGLISPMPGGIGVREITIYGLYDFYYGLGGIAFLAIIIMRIITYVSLFLAFLLERGLTSFFYSARRNRVNASS
ncbi:flippase-like domain-containing protein [candidate division KSB1 bacterium]|nr:flippase-like domain-containing protein [candidate division KSB1 bacterium]